MTNKAKIILIACIWLLVAFAMVIINEKVFVNGETINLEVLPVSKAPINPETHVLLNFNISKITVDNPFIVSRGQRVYAILKKGTKDIYDIDRLETEMPKTLKKGEIAIVGNVTYTYSNPQIKEGYISVDYGIDTFFTPKDQLAEVKKGLVNGGIAEVKVSKWGAAKVIGFKK